jgi:hypothetical protein
MANLSERLPTEIDSQKRYIAPSAPAPSILEHIANFGSNVLGVAATAIDHRANEKKAAVRAQKLSADNDVAKGWLQVAGQTVPPEVASDPNAAAAVQSAQTAAPAMLKQQTAANQGVIDPGAAQARMLSMARQVYAKHPGYEAFVFSALKEAGVTDMITQHYKNAEAHLERADVAKDDRRNDMLKLAETKYGYSDIDKMPVDQQEVAIATVSAAEEAEHSLDIQSKKIELLGKQQTLSDQQRTSLQTQLSSDLATSANQYLTKSFTSANLVAMNMLGDPVLANDPARLEKLQSHFFSVVIPGMKQMWATKMGPILLKMTPADREAVTKNFDSQVSSFTDMLAGPQSIVAANTRIMTEISNTYGIEFAKASPTLMRVQKIVGPSGMATLLDPAIQGNAALRAQLAAELKGAIADPSKAVSFSAFVQHLADGTDLSSFNPEQIKSMAPSSIAATSVLAKNTPASNGTDKEGHKVLVNSIKNTAGIAVDVTPAWGFKNVLTQGKVLNQSGVTRSLFFTNANVQERDAAIRAWFPATQRTYEALKRSNAGDSYYNVQMDPHTLTWKTVWNGKKIAPENKPDALTDAEYESMAKNGQRNFQLVQPKPTTAVLEQAATLNTMLGNLSQAGSKKYDDTFQGKVIPYNEARRFYATGEVPATLEKANSKSKNGKTPEQNVDDAISHMLDFVNKLPTDGSPSDVSTPSSVKPKTVGPSPYAQVIGDAATKYSIPPSIAAALFGTETTGGKNTHTSDKGAIGVGQIMPGTASHYGVTDLHALKPEENIDLAMHILSDNYKATGNWKDALAMYHSGVDLATAARQGRTDGHMRTVDYVASTMNAASSISPENLKRYGYVRY